MTHQDKISVLVTFLFGLFAGAYLYLTGFAPTFELPEATTDNVYKEFVITAESFGECKSEGNCSSFQVLENGSYRLINESPAGKPVVKEGSIPGSLKSELESNLNTVTLARLSKERIEEDCRYEGTNYNFRVSLSEVNYTVNTCDSAVDYESVEWLTLAKLWNYFANLK